MTKNVINSNKNISKPTDVTFSTSHSIDGNKLTVRLTFLFTPFNFRNYKWNIHSNEVIKNNGKKTILYTNNEKLNWIKNTIYNYAPFGLCKAKEYGAFNSINEGLWEEIESWETGEGSTNNFTHNFSLKNGLSILDNVITTELNTYACEKNILTTNDDWYNTIIGKSFKFGYALNTNMFFSLVNPQVNLQVNPQSFADFDDILEDLNKHSEDDTYSIWLPNKKEKVNKVTITSTTDIDITHTQTFAVVAANPFTREIYTKYIVIDPPTQQPKEYAYNYVKDSIYIDNSNKITANVNSQNNHIYINVSGTDKSDTTWKNTNPRISFKIKKTEI